MSITPRSAELRQQTTVYLSDAKLIINQSLSAVQKSATFADIYHVSLSADTALRGLASARLRPRLGVARSVVLRVPLLVAIGQQSVAMVELRRFLELVCWTVYFTDHPVEWRKFEAQPGVGFTQDIRKPISYSAHRELSYYIEYARELMASEESGLGIGAVDRIKQISRELNAAVHAGHMVRAAGRKPPHDDVSEATLRKFSSVQRRVFSGCSILLAAYCTPQFDRLKAGARAHFDWLVGGAVRKQIRQGPFGLRST